MGSGSAYFSLDVETGEISTLKTLNFAEELVALLGANVTFSFEVTITDGGGLTASCLYELNIEGSNRAPEVCLVRVVSAASTFSPAFFSFDRRLSFAVATFFTSLPKQRALVSPHTGRGHHVQPPRRHPVREIEWKH